MPQTAVITGAAKGIGQVLAKAFLQADFNVLMTDADDQALAGARDELAHYNRVQTQVLDVRNKNDFEQALNVAQEHFGAAQVLINNAAITPTTPVLEITPEEFSQVLDINLRGCFLGCQVFGAYFAQQNQGRIINMASLAGQMGGTASGAHYASSKAGIITLTKIFARQFAGQGVTVNAVAPGPVLVDSITEKVPPEKLAEIIDTMIPVKQMSDPRLIADMALLLASDQAATVTGATWDANGGIFMR
ncbi:SDR family NAD(P)-dependent oxidoreductase [Halioxenophilus aromaticivorans]|uniref:SDR family NAD(P)-dependent oxidoreductase n=1 Tax=Halioxenophilus aromaticivorans TaxID=1306992 RepID=A0AAV3U5F4_9ALTE